MQTPARGIGDCTCCDRIVCSDDVEVEVIDEEPPVAPRVDEIMLHSEPPMMTLQENPVRINPVAKEDEEFTQDGKAPPQKPAQGGEENPESLVHESEPSLLKRESAGSVVGGKKFQKNRNISLNSSKKPFIAGSQLEAWYFAEPDAEVDRKQRWSWLNTASFDDSRKWNLGNMSSGKAVLISLQHYRWIVCIYVGTACTSGLGMLVCEIFPPAGAGNYPNDYAYVGFYLFEFLCCLGVTTGVVCGWDITMFRHPKMKRAAWFTFTSNVVWFAPLIIYAAIYQGGSAMHYTFAWVFFCNFGMPFMIVPMCLYVVGCGLPIVSWPLTSPKEVFNKVWPGIFWWMRTYMADFAACGNAVAFLTLDAYFLTKFPSSTPFRLIRVIVVFITKNFGVYKLIGIAITDHPRRRFKEIFTLVCHLKCSMLTMKGASGCKNWSDFGFFLGLDFFFFLLRSWCWSGHSGGCLKPVAKHIRKALVWGKPDNQYLTLSAWRAKDLALEVSASSAACLGALAFYFICWAVVPRPWNVVSSIFPDSKSVLFTFLCFCSEQIQAIATCILIEFRGHGENISELGRTSMGSPRAVIETLWGSMYGTTTAVLFLMYVYGSIADKEKPTWFS